MPGPGDVSTARISQLSLPYFVNPSSFPYAPLLIFIQERVLLKLHAVGFERTFDVAPQSALLVASSNGCSS